MQALVPDDWWHWRGSICSLLPRVLVFTILLVPACSHEEPHDHAPGTHGGIIIPVGQDHYHIEALFTDAGELKLFTLGQDETQVVEVESQTVTAYVQTGGSASSKAVQLEPKPVAGDQSGKTSQFVGQLPKDLGSGRVLVVVPSIRIGDQRYRFSFTTSEPLMPAKVSDDAERDLYLTPAGMYTQDDIVANGSTTASEKFKSFRSVHDMHPHAGELICPITRTKANPECTWIVGGKKYQFCCPPCIDEFVKLAKENPDRIRDPSAYVAEPAK